jgi:hypothetical protein
MQLFGRVHAAEQDTFNKEKDDVSQALEMICQVTRDDVLPLLLDLLKSGGVKQRSRLIEVAAELGMPFVSKSRESLATLAQGLLSDVVEGCTLANLLKGGSLLAALLIDESELEHESLRDSKVFRYLIDSLGPVAEEPELPARIEHPKRQGLEAPKRVVSFLVEFEKVHAEDRRKNEITSKEDATFADEKKDGGNTDDYTAGCPLPFKSTCLICP